MSYALQSGHGSALSVSLPFVSLPVLGRQVFWLVLLSTRQTWEEETPIEELASSHGLVGYIYSGIFLVANWCGIQFTVRGATSGHAGSGCIRKQPGPAMRSKQ